MKKHKLNDDNLVSDKVKLSEIISFVKIKENSTNALQILIKKCQEMEQGLVLKNEFIRARDIIECSICSKSVPIRDSLNDKGHCIKCANEIAMKIKHKIAKERLIQQWETLAQELKKINPQYVLIKTENATTIELKTDISAYEDKSLIFNIYREAIYYDDRWSRTTHKYALRISSTAFGLEAQRLRKNFTSKNVAISLNKKIEALYEQHKAKIEKNKQKTKDSRLFITTIMQDFKVSETSIHAIYMDYGRSHRTRISEYRKKVTYKNIELVANLSNNDTVTYTISGIRNFNKDGCFTVSQIKKIAQFIKKLSK